MLLTTFTEALSHALNLPMIVAVIISGFLCGFVIASAHRFAHTDINPAMVAVLGSTLMCCLQVATDIGSSIARPENSMASNGGHLGYFILSIISGVSCWPGAMLARRYFFRPHPVKPLPDFNQKVRDILSKH